MTYNVCVEYTIMFGPNKGERTTTWFPAEDPEIKRICNDPRMKGEVVDKV